MEKRSRTERRKEARAKNRRLRTTAIVVGAIVLVALAVLLVISVMPLSSDEPSSAGAETTQTPKITLEETATSADIEPRPEVEVPDVTGLPLDEAEMLLRYAGLAVEAKESAVSTGGEPGIVASQEPGAGTTVPTGSTIDLTYVPIVESAAEQESGPVHLVVVLDPGHQSASDLSLEPNGPDSTVMKEKVRGGSTGVETRIPEYETVLQIALSTRDILTAAGVEVVMTRSSNDVNISNKERAEVANQAGADLFVRIHCDGAGDPDINGISTLYPQGNSWVAPIEGRSKVAAQSIQAAVVTATDAADRGTVARDDITGFNWAKVPSVLVECGFLSNPVEDRLLSGKDYRDRVAQGIADGVMEYLGQE